MAIHIYNAPDGTIPGIVCDICGEPIQNLKTASIRHFSLLGECLDPEYVHNHCVSLEWDDPNSDYEYAPLDGFLQLLTSNADLDHQLCLHPELN
jgi:hypothetical protein